MKQNEMNETEMQQFVTENISIVPKNQLKKVQGLELKKQVSKIQFYIDVQKMKADAAEKNKIVNKVADLFDRRKASIEEVKEVIKFAQEFVDSFKQRQIEDIDRQIAELEELKLNLK